MVTRESTLRQSFDPAAFHRSANMAQTGWAEREVNDARGGLRSTVARFSSSITLLLGALLVLALRPVDVMDPRDVVVSSLAIGVSWLVAVVITRPLMAILRTNTSAEVDRVVTWSVALGLALILSSMGIVADFSRDVDDYIDDVPGYTLTNSPEMKSDLQAARGRPFAETFSDVGVWTLHRDLKMIGTLSVHVTADADDAVRLGGKALFERALAGRSNSIRRERLEGQSIMVSHSGGQAHLGWLDGSALVVASGKSRDWVNPVAAALIEK